ncbi:hypothetical protein [Streptomyces sp. NRRL S-337]|uniref:hypothetical protein n=1 Tax=Streptomyces sp. NRRL S-337 TaxID=1463900 RepID=UPI00068ACBD8|nr:hypothetical protein [Streptomyces sp. NRRL S-337]
MTPQQARDLVRSVFGDGIHAEVTGFPGGNLSLALCGSRHSATVDGHPDTGWAYTVDPGEDDGFTGHDRAADTLEEALRAIHGTLTD